MVRGRHHPATDRLDRACLSQLIYLGHRHGCLCAPLILTFPSSSPFSLPHPCPRVPRPCLSLFLAPALASRAPRPFLLVRVRPCPRHFPDLCPFPGDGGTFPGQVFLGGFNVTSSYIGGFEAEPLRSAADVGENNYLYHIAEIPGQTSATPEVFVLGTFEGKEFRFDTKDAVTTTGQYPYQRRDLGSTVGGLH